MTTTELARRLGFGERKSPVLAPDSTELTLGYEAAYPFLAESPEQDEGDEALVPVRWRD